MLSSSYVRDDFGLSTFFVNTIHMCRLVKSAWGLTCKCKFLKLRNCMFSVRVQEDKVNFSRQIKIRGHGVLKCTLNALFAISFNYHTPLWCHAIVTRES